MDVHRVLFVCRENIGRSQVGAAFYNQLHQGEAESAGINVDIPGQKVGDRPEAKYTIDVMKRDYNIDISECRRQRVSQEMKHIYAHIFVMAELNVIPDWLGEFPRWNVPDLKGLSEDKTRETIGDIHSLVSSLV